MVMPPALKDMSKRNFLKILVHPFSQEVALKINVNKIPRVLINIPQFGNNQIKDEVLILGET